MSIESATRNLGAVRNFVRQHAEASGFPAAAVQQMMLAVDEACSNVIRHAYSGDEQGRVEVEISIGPETFRVIIRDHGQAFKPSAYEPPNLYHSVKRRKGGGFGVHIMRRLMDEVEYATRGGVNEVRLTKHRTPQSGDGL
ncbi:MAG: ATP-binding protein [Bacteroidota bacterium]